MIDWESESHPPTHPPIAMVTGSVKPWLKLHLKTIFDLPLAVTPYVPCTMEIQPYLDILYEALIIIK